VVLTPWTPIDGCPPELAALHDAERDELFRRMVTEVLAEVMPVPLLQQLLELDVDIVAKPGAFFVAFRQEPNQWHLVPEISERLRLLPWREQDEPIQ
jgi:hypothetical protein